jgi:hypothetical protein
MKTLFIIFCFVLVCFNISGQAANQVFANDTTKGSQTKYFIGAKESGNYQGIAGFVFTTAHDNATFYLDGCYTANNWQPIDTLSVTGSTLVSRFMFQAPPKYKYYRLRVVGNGGDTCYIANIRYILKY